MTYSQTVWPGQRRVDEHSSTLFSIINFRMKRGDLNQCSLYSLRLSESPRNYCYITLLKLWETNKWSCHEQKSKVLGYFSFHLDSRANQKLGRMNDEEMWWKLKRNYIIFALRKKRWKVILYWSSIYERLLYIRWSGFLHLHREQRKKKCV